MSNANVRPSYIRKFFPGWYCKANQHTTKIRMTRLVDVEFKIQDEEIMPVSKQATTSLFDSFISKVHIVHDFSSDITKEYMQHIWKTRGHITTIEMNGEDSYLAWCAITENIHHFQSLKKLHLASYRIDDLEPLQHLQCSNDLRLKYGSLRDCATAQPSKRRV